MSITVTTDVFCDGCGVWCHGTTGPRVAIRTARTEARLQGWRCDSEVDWCPDCRKAAA